MRQLIAHIRQARRLILVTTFLTGLAAAGASILIHNRYTATVRFTLTGEEFDASQLLGGLAALAGRLPASLRPGTSTSPDLAKAVATMDRTIGAVLLSHPDWTDSSVLAHLQIDIPDSAKQWETALRKLRDRVTVTADINTNIVSISLWDKNRRWSAAIATSLAAETDTVLQLSRSSRAAALERFLVRQLDAARDTLSETEDALLDFNLRNRSVQQSPTLTLRAARLQRLVEAAQEVYTTLDQQAAAARLREAQNTPALSVLDPARVPYRKSWPPRAILTVVAMLLAAVMSSAWSFKEEILKAFAANR